MHAIETENNRSHFVSGNPVTMPSVSSLSITVNYSMFQIPKALNFSAPTLSKAYLFCAPQKYGPTYRTAYLYFNATNLGLNEGGHGCIRYIAEQIEEAINLDVQKLFTVEGHSDLRKVESDILYASDLKSKFLGVRPVIFQDSIYNYAYFLTYFIYDQSPNELSRLSETAKNVLHAASPYDNVAYLYSFDYGLTVEGLAGKLGLSCSKVRSRRTECLENLAQSLMQAKKLETCEITADILKHFVESQTLVIRGTIEFDYICLSERTFRMTPEGEKHLNFRAKSKKYENFSTTFESKGFRKLMSEISCSSKREPGANELTNHQNYFEEIIISETPLAVLDEANPDTPTTTRKHKRNPMTNKETTRKITIMPSTNAAYHVITPERLALLAVLCLTRLI
ncbi:unnamed protein product [Calicophoron daubneyi]|uniref:Uncharacterized protein n=1 Tax=Calicophoron daubneyi TaxID=300641 RepID=A0AAV2TVC6_CALDB